MLIVKNVIKEHYWLLWEKENKEQTLLPSNQCLLQTDPTYKGIRTIIIVKITLKSKLFSLL